MEHYHVEWAKQHDWFLTAVATMAGYVILVKAPAEPVEAIETFADLRNYAGY